MRSDSTIGQASRLLTGLGLGAGLMYFLDPQRRTGRAGRIRDKLIHYRAQSAQAADATARDAWNRLCGLKARALGALWSAEVSDEVLEERVRSRVGRVVSHPGSIEVVSRDGSVNLFGPILEHEVKDLMQTVCSVPGVVEVHNRLDIHKEAGNIPGLQGGRPRPGQRRRATEEVWDPTTRLVAGLGGGLLLCYGLKQRSPIGLAVGMAGGAMLVRALSNLPLKRVTGLQSGRRGIDIQKTIQIAAPIEQVFDFWLQFENFPNFFHNVRSVCQVAPGRYRWTVAGPAGAPVEWDAVITKLVENELLAWKTLPDAAVQHAGIVQFQRAPDGGTRVNIRMSYNPVAGAIGHAVASLFGVDPKSEMDSDLVRFKTFLETGKPAHDAAQPVADTIRRS